MTTCSPGTTPNGDVSTLTDPCAIPGCTLEAPLPYVPAPKPVKYCWSDDEQYFDGEYETREEALEVGCDARNKEATIWTGVQAPARQPKFTRDDVDEIIERKQDQAIDQVGDAAEGWLASITTEKLEELRVGFDKVFQAWLVKYELKPTWFEVIDVQEHPFGE